MSYHLRASFDEYGFGGSCVFYQLINIMNSSPLPVL